MLFLCFPLVYLYHVVVGCCCSNSKWMRCPVCCIYSLNKARIAQQQQEQLSDVVRWPVLVLFLSSDFWLIKGALIFLVRCSFSWLSLFVSIFVDSFSFRNEQHEVTNKRKRWWPKLQYLWRESKNNNKWIKRWKLNNRRKRPKLLRWEVTQMRILVSSLREYSASMLIN